MSKVILLVDDNASIRRFCRDELEGDGYRVLLAGDGIEAIRVFARCRPDVVVVDMHMPRCGGWEVVKQIRQLAPAAPMVLHTSLTGDWPERTGLPCVRKTEDLTSLRRAIAAAVQVADKPPQCAATSSAFSSVLP